MTVLALPALVASPAHSQAPYPTKPIRIVVPFPPGGGVELLARIVGGKLTEAWGHPILIDHRPGASATLGADLVAKSPPDGHTLVLVTTSFTMIWQLIWSPSVCATTLTLTDGSVVVTESVQGSGTWSMRRGWALMSR